MSLKVWLPLNGNFQNNGASSFADYVMPSGASWSAGKLGNNLNISNAGTTQTISDIANLSTFSISVWYKLTPDKTFTQWRDIICISMTAGSELRLEVCNTSGTTTNWFGHNLDASGMASYATTLGVWYHDVITVNNTEIKRYVDGVLKTTKTVAVGVSGSSLRIGDGGMYFQIADVRVYDHALSKKEVKELSKGLVVHYPLANNGLGLPNMVDDSATFNGWSVASGWTKVVTDDGSIGYQFTRTGATSNDWYRIIPTLKIDGNDYPNGITISMDILTPDKSVINQKCLGSLQQYNSEGSRTGWYEPGWDLTNVVNGQWSRVSFFFTQSALLTNSQGLVYSYTQFSFQLVQNGDITIRKIKAEAGNKATPYTISSNDSYITNIENDVSGYMINGTRSNITYSSNTLRNSASTVFDGTSSGIEINSNIFPVVLNGPFTVSMWVYDQETGGRSIFFGNYNLTGSFFNIEKEGSNKARFWWNGNPDFHCSNSSIASNAWTYLVMTRDGNTVKCYINGVLTDTSTATLSGTVPTNATVFRLGRDGRSDATMFKGQMSDFRLYATVLSDTDIKELYNQPISFNKHSTIIQGEYIEK